ncbi:hypothetical protein [Cohnella cellulosilytica]|uniref:Uncharacterized protein n=1 Tax=Cohnella cellulosilytica TaxID=986710 RepID=A0ABW2FIS8_9BACL
MEHIFDFVQLVLSIGLISSVLILPFDSLSIRAVRWSDGAVAAGLMSFISVRQLQFNRIQRWIARIARRKEAPDEDAIGLSPH